MKFSTNWLNKYTDLPTKDLEKLNKIIDQIAYQIVDVDERWLSEEDGVIDIDNKIVTNRPYCFGHRGLAREVSVMLDQAYRGADYPSLPAKSADLPIKVTVEDPDLCPRFTALSIKGVKVGPSPEWLVKLLESVGQRSINNLVDITNFIMLDTAQPVHAYDYHKVANAHIVVRRAKEGEKVVTLDGVERGLNSNVLLITDEEKPIGIGGVMGAGNSEIDENTTDVILEIASFHPINIRQTAKFLKHRTDAVQRFEKGPDALNIPNVMAEMAALIVETCGGEVASDYIDVANLDKSSLRTQPLKMEFDVNRVDKLLGFGIDEAFIERVFKGFDIKVNTKNGNVWSLEIPTYRPDLKEPADLIEDIGRMFGYQNIPSITPVNRLVVPAKNLKLTVLNKIRKALTGSGLDEVITYPFIAEKDVAAIKSKDAIEIVNPLSEEYKYLRPTLIASHAKVVGHNLKYFDDFGIFETSRKFIKKLGVPKAYSEDHGESQRPDEIQVVSMMYYSKTEKERSAFRLKSALENLMKQLRIQNYELKEDGVVVLNDKEIGRIGLVEKDVLDTNDIEYPVSYMELDIQSLVDNYNDTVQFVDYSRYQGSKIDYSVLVPMNLAVSEVYKAIPEHEWIVRKEVIDVYKELKDVKDKKSVSISLYLQKMDGNITSEEVYEIGAKVEESLKKIKDLEIRGGGVKKSIAGESVIPQERSELRDPQNINGMPEQVRHDSVGLPQDNNIVIGKIVSIDAHPNADKLVICKVDVGSAKPEGGLFSDYMQIVTGASNIKPGIAEGKFVPVALPGANVLEHRTGKPIKIGKANLRGEKTEAMLCSKDELGLKDFVGGIWILDESKYADKVGLKFDWIEADKNSTGSAESAVAPELSAKKFITDPIYLMDSYAKEMDAEVLDVQEEGNSQYRLILDKTVFYPMGGGQGTDQGKMTSEKWSGEVYQVMNKDGNIAHYVKTSAKPQVGDKIHGELDWDRRYKNMRLHSGGHVVDFAMYMLGYSPKQLMPYKGDHYKNPHIVYKGKIDKDIREELEVKSNEIVEKGMTFSWQFQSVEDLNKEAIYLQPGLPTNKPLRTLRLEGVGAVADGGTQVKNTNEVGKIKLEISVEGEDTIVKYAIDN